MKSGGTAAATLNGHTADEQITGKHAIRGRVTDQDGADGRVAAAEESVTARKAARAASPPKPRRKGGGPAGAVPDTAASSAAEQPAAARPTAEQPAGEQPTAGEVHSEAATEAHRQALVLDFFAQPVRDYVYQSMGRPVTVLRAGRVTSLAELGLDRLRQDGFDVSVVTVDVDHGRRARTEPETHGEVTVGDLRSIPLPPRSFDVVHCSLLLDRIGHVPLVLDRFAAGLRPGGLLLLRIRDRDCAAGFLDRRLPGWVRQALWKRLYPGEPGPFPAIYEPTGSGRGVAVYMQMRGLVITQRRTTRTLPCQPERLTRILSVARGLIAWLSRGRLTDTHDEMLFVIRKPEDRFARVVLTPRRPGGVPRD